MGIMDLVPPDVPEYMIPAWASCMSWAIGQAEIVAAFRAETGNNWKPGKNGLERMIDDATGAGDAFVAEFIIWANHRVWGPVDAAEVPE